MLFLLTAKELQFRQGVSRLGTRVPRRESFNKCGPARRKNRLSFAGPARAIGKIISHLLARPGTVLGPGPGPCRPLVYILDEIRI